MLSSRRMWLPTLTAVLTAVASSLLVAAPASAATVTVKVVGESKIAYRASDSNKHTVTITGSGRTITIDDRVRIKPGRGCATVHGDATKVKCVTSEKATKVTVTLGLGNDSVTNKSAVRLIADGGGGNDTLRGGKSADVLNGGVGDDKLYGNGGNDELIGRAGTNLLDGGAGADSIMGGQGVDTINGGDGDDDLQGGPGPDVIYGGDGDDELVGYIGAQVRNGDADLLDGGDNRTEEGDYCLVGLAGSTENCESPTPSVV